MKSAAINTLSYTGIVTLSQYRGNKKIPIKQFKNSGGNSLFNFLANCFLGDFNTASAELPTKIMLLKTERDKDGNYGSIESVSGFYSLFTKPERLFTDSGVCSSTICYSFVIPADIIENTTFNSIGLYANMAAESDKENFAAICELGNISETWSSSSVLVIDWRLTITNNS